MFKPLNANHNQKKIYETMQYKVHKKYVRHRLLGL
jgi:hypothetical protein